MAAFAIKSSAVRWIDESGIMLLLAFSIRPRLIADERLARLDVGELDRPFADLDAAFRLPRHGEREVARSPGSGKSERKCAPREFSRLQRRERNDAADLDERAQIEPILPGQIEAPIVAGDAGRQQFRLDAVERL